MKSSWKISQQATLYNTLRYLAPEILEWLCAQLRIMRRVFDINVAKPQLQSPSVMPRIGQQMPTRVPEHVRVQ